MPPQPNLLDLLAGDDMAAPATVPAAAAAPLVDPFAAGAASSPPLTRVAKVVATLFDAEGKSHGPHAFLMDLRRGGRLVDGGKVNIL